MLLNLQTLALHSRDDQDSDSDDDDFGADDEDEDDAWRTVVDRDIFVDGVRVGWIKGVVLRREEMAGCFQELMSQVSPEAHQLSTLFDDSGIMHPELLGPNGIARGTGVWGDEVNSGSFAFVSEIVVESSAHRGQGVGRLALATFCESLVSGTGFDPGLDWDPIDFVFCWPNYLEHALERQSAGPEAAERVQSRAVDRSVRFFRRFGFRRIGRTPFFAFALTNNDHPSRRLPPALDAPPPPSPPPNLADAFPLHHRIMNSPSLHGEPDPDLLRYISLVAPLSLVRTPDYAAHTPLHIAAGSANLGVCQSLVGRSRAEMWMREAVKGMTPVEVVRAERRGGGGGEPALERRRVEVERYLESEMDKGLMQGSQS